MAKKKKTYNDKKVKAKVKANLQRVFDRGYMEIIDIEFVESLMYMFHVPKGSNDIWMVYNKTKSGLNDALYAPWFLLLIVDTMCRWVVARS